MDQIVESLKNLLVLRKSRVPLSSEALVFGLLRFDLLILEKHTVGLGQFLHQCSLPMGCLQQAILIRSELLKLGLKELILVV